MDKRALMNAYMVTFLSGLARSSRTTIFFDAWGGKSPLLEEPGVLPSARSLRRDIAKLDQLRSHVAHTQCDPGGPEVAFPAWCPAGLVLAIDEALLPHLRQGVLRLVDAIRAAFRLIVIRVLNALARYPDRVTFILRLLASSRCYGHRAEPGDHTSPFSASMPVVTGEAARPR